MATEYVIVTTTTADQASAQALANTVVAAGLGACAQVSGPIQSVYRWEGEVKTEPEWRIDVKTTAGRAPELVTQINQVHAYDLPEVVVTAIEGGSAPYLSWIAEQTN